MMQKKKIEIGIVSNGIKYIIYEIKKSSGKSSLHSILNVRDIFKLNKEDLNCFLYISKDSYNKDKFIKLARKLNLKLANQDEYTSLIEENSSKDNNSKQNQKSYIKIDDNYKKFYDKYKHFIQIIYNDKKINIKGIYSRSPYSIREAYITLILELIKNTRYRNILINDKYIVNKDDFPKDRNSHKIEGCKCDGKYIYTHGDNESFFRRLNRIRKKLNIDIKIKPKKE